MISNDNPQEPEVVQGNDGFGVGEKSLQFRNLLQTDGNETMARIDEPEKTRTIDDTTVTSNTESPITSKSDELDSDENGSPTPTLRPMAVLRFVAPTLALWIAPPVM